MVNRIRLKVDPNSITVGVGVTSRLHRDRHGICVGKEIVQPGLDRTSVGVSGVKRRNPQVDGVSLEFHHSKTRFGNLLGRSPGPVRVLLRRQPYHSFVNGCVDLGLAGLR
ncbi:hypothetical protein ES703_19827 [subsurface metagenome]